MNAALHPGCSLGNQALQRLSRTHALADHAAAKHREKEGGDSETDAGVGVDKPDAGVNQPVPLDSPVTTPTAPTPAVPATPAAHHVTPNFVLDKKEDARSNTKSSTQSKSDPTFVGGVVASGAAWHYQLNSVESKGKIRIVYFTADRYPAPTPTDDSGALSNVTSANWNDIVTDLDKNKAGIPDFWSAYRAEDVHESFHWEVEWQGEMKKELVKAENDIAGLSVAKSAAPTAADAERVLAPQAATVFDAAMQRADASYQALPDRPGAPAYNAQIPVVTALANRVKAFAHGKGW